MTTPGFVRLRPVEGPGFFPRQTGTPRTRSAAARSVPPSLSLRAWQEDAISVYLESQPKDFMVSSTPGVGKKFMTLALANHLLASRIVEKIIVVCALEYRCIGWMESASTWGLNLDSDYRLEQGRPRHGIDGVIVTYEHVANNAQDFKELVQTRKTLVVFDEVHHIEHVESLRRTHAHAFNGATRRIALRCSPHYFAGGRDEYAILPPFDGAEDTVEYTYSYGEALRDGVVRPITFIAPRDHEVLNDDQELPIPASSGPTKDSPSEIDPKGRWILKACIQANEALKELRKRVPAAAGLIIAHDSCAARLYGARIGSLTGTRPTLLLDEDPKLVSKISAFNTTQDPWVVATPIVAQSMDIPRLQVGLYATHNSSPLYFSQVVGRFARARGIPTEAFLYLPPVREVLTMALRVVTHEGADGTDSAD
ncbi:MAG: DEAD/DEAH box helicase family protein [Actinomycetaceae bacterium]|nr:DEAD/DEAH box helicase family protein [Actinomycetaceae bacterium]